MSRSSTVTIVPGWTSRMPFQTAVPEVVTGPMSSRNPSRSTARGAIGFAKTALGSEPNNTPSGIG